jgi:hypothetical protein
MFNRPKYRLSNPAMRRAFPYEQRPEDDNWFDRHPLISGSIAGAVFAGILFIGFFGL